MLNNANFAIVQRLGKHFRIADKVQFNNGYIADQVFLGFNNTYTPNKWAIHFDGNGYFVTCDTLRQAIEYLTKHYARVNKGLFI